MSTAECICPNTVLGDMLDALAGKPNVCLPCSELDTEEHCLRCGCEVCAETNAPCKHGFQEDVCPTCTGLASDHWAADVNRSTLKECRARYLKALAVVEAARLYVKADEDGEPWPAPAVTLRTALAAYDEVAK